jgi:hypothetical protein
MQLQQDENPKSGGMGGDGGTADDLMMSTHAAVRELLTAMEGMSAPAGVSADVFDAFRSRAQVARRRLEDIDADLKVKKDAVVSSVQVSPAAGAIPAVHIHVHLHLSPANGSGR